MRISHLTALLLVVPACTPFFDTTPTGEFGEVDDTGTDTNVEQDATDVTDLGDAGELNLCGGTRALIYDQSEARPGDSCGACSEGGLVCNGPESLRCVGASEPNECGGCIPLDGAVGQACGECGEGSFTCQDGTLVCGDERPGNACGGCGTLEHEPGTPCVVGGVEGTWVCGEGELTCVSGDVNACGGEDPLTYEESPATPGEPCSAACGDGLLACDPADGNRLDCVAEAENLCGGCSDLGGVPGQSCSRCGEFSCSGTETLVCEGPDPNACGGCVELPVEPGERCDDGSIAHCVGETVSCEGLNECGGDEALDGTPGEECAPCKRWVCNGVDRVACAGPDPNECGGCVPLPALGAPCGECATGNFVCDGESLRCAGEEADARNECDGCGELSGEPGDDCGTCGGRYECVEAVGDVVCTVEENACGGCDELPGEPLSTCDGECGTGRWRCDGETTACIGAGVARNACGACGELPDELGDACGCGGLMECSDGGLSCSNLRCDGIAPCPDGVCPFRGNCVYEFCQDLPTATNISRRDDEASDGAEFGFSIATNDDWLAIGAPGYGSDAGRVYIFEPNVGGWSLTDTIGDAFADPGDRFGHALALNDDGLLAIGVPGGDTNAEDSGHVYVFEPPDESDGFGDWSRRSTSLGSSDPRQAVGTSVTWIDGDTLAAGAPSRELPGGLSGVVIVFSLEDEGWSTTTTLEASMLSSAVTGLGFGASLAGGADRLVIGAPLARVGSDDAAGAVLQLPRAGGSWSTGITLTQPEPQAGAEFGQRVALGPGTTAITAPLADGEESAAENEGAVFYYTAGGATGPTRIRVTPSDIGEGSEFGSAGVAIAGDWLAVGSWADDSAGDNTGAVWVFALDGDGGAALEYKFVHPDAGSEDLGGTLALTEDTLFYGVLEGASGDEDDIAWEFSPL